MQHRTSFLLNIYLHIAHVLSSRSNPQNQTDHPRRARPAHRTHVGFGPDGVGPVNAECGLGRSQVRWSESFAASPVPKACKRISTQHWHPQLQKGVKSGQFLARAVPHNYVEREFAHQRWHCRQGTTISEFTCLIIRANLYRSVCVIAAPWMLGKMDTTFQRSLLVQWECTLRK